MDPVSEVGVLYEPDLPYPVPEPHETVDEAPPGVRAAVEEADTDIAAGRYVICESQEAFDALLDELTVQPRAS